HGPAALILSYILHGNVPYYDLARPHPDRLLHRKLVEAGYGGRPLLPHGMREVEALTSHFPASAFPHSQQALPLNALLDSLRRPHAYDEAENERESCVRWERRPELAVPHLVLGDSQQCGGQWSTCPAGARMDVQSLSYTGQLSLPGLPFAQWLALASQESSAQCRSDVDAAAFKRPQRGEMAAYLATYPAQVGIADAVRLGRAASGVRRQGDGFYIASHGLWCRRLVLASGVVAEDLPVPDHLRPLANLPLPDTGGASSAAAAVTRAPLLIIGSGFSAADAIISAAPQQQIIHVYKWDADSPSPLAAGHAAVYPMSSAIYQLMRAAASGSRVHVAGSRGSSPVVSFLQSRDWNGIYEGMPNATVTGVAGDQAATPRPGTMQVTIALASGDVVSREVSGLLYVTGRRGRLGYLSSELVDEVTMPVESSSPRLSGATETDATAAPGDASRPSHDLNIITGATLRAKAAECTEVAPRVYVVGSLTGDSLLRYAYGSCAYAAGAIMRDKGLLCCVPLV
ncbi:hypothetical protein KEM52_003009, partial [Ascosphaera acerosa]